MTEVLGVDHVYSSVSNMGMIGRTIALTGSLLIGLLGCDLSGLGDAPPGACSESGAQCQLSDGPLGVCERTTCAAGQTPPCFACTPQH